MKIIILALFTLTFLVLAFSWAYHQTVAAMQTCIDQATVTSQNDLAWVMQNQPSQTDLCTRAQTQYLELKTCYRQVTQKYFVPTALVETVMVRSIPNFPRLSRNQEFLQRACPETSTHP